MSYSPVNVAENDIHKEMAMLTGFFLCGMLLYDQILRNEWEDVHTEHML